MVIKDLSYCKNLQEFYSEIRALHIRKHKRSYVDTHDDLMSTAKSLGIPIDQVVYRESGVHQGASAGAMASIGVKHLQLIDVSFKLFNPARKHFENAGVRLDMHECSSIATPIELFGNVYKTATKQVLNLSPANIAFFDAMHEPDFVYEELQTHAHSITDYIFIHDTYQFRRPKDKKLCVDMKLHEAAEKFVAKYNEEWMIDYHHKVNCGYTKLKRLG